MAFSTTRWTLLTEATLNGDASGRASLARLCELYRRPVEAHLSSRGLSASEVEDLTQDFFLKLLEARVWKRADQDRGKFRTFLLAVLNNMHLHRVRHEACVKRGGGVEPDSLEWLEDSGIEIAGDQSANSMVFDRAWAYALVSSAVTTVAEEFERRHSTAEFAVLRKFLPGSSVPPAYHQAAAELGMSEVAVRTAVSRLRQHFREVLRSAVARTVSAPHEVDEELRYLAMLMMQPDVSMPQPGPNGKDGHA